MFKNYLVNKSQWQDEKLVYSFGRQDRQKSTEIPSKEVPLKLTEFISSPLSEHHVNFVAKSGLLWDTKQEKALEKGNLIHHLMSLIKTTHDIDFAFTELKNSGLVSKEQEGLLRPVVHSIVSHSKLAPYFSSDYIIYNEREIILYNGRFSKTR